MDTYRVVDGSETARRLAHCDALAPTQRATAIAAVEPQRAAARGVTSDAPRPQHSHPGIARLVCEVTSTPDPEVMSQLLRVIMNDISEDCPGAVRPARPDSPS
jgi:hypothetical protein